MQHSSHSVDDAVPTAQSQDPQAATLKIPESESPTRDHPHLGMESFGYGIGFGEPPHLKAKPAHEAQHSDSSVTVIIFANFGIWRDHRTVSGSIIFASMCDVTSHLNVLVMHFAVFWPVVALELRVARTLGVPRSPP